MRIKWLTAFYLLALCLIVFLADRQQTQHLFNFIWAIPYGDKCGHFFLMGTLSFLLNLSLSKSHPRKPFLSTASLIVFSLVALEEFSQIFVRGRTFDLMDLLFDALGILLFGHLAQLIKARQQKFS